MRPRFGLIAPFPLAGFLAANAMGTVAIVAGAVLVILAILGFVLIVSSDVAPELDLGKLKLRFKRLQGAPRRGARSTSDPPGRAEPEAPLAPPWAGRKTIRERVRALPCGRTRDG